jgi:hypothetical protein
MFDVEFGLRARVETLDQLFQARFARDQDHSVEHEGHPLKKFRAFTRV